MIGRDYETKNFSFDSIHSDGAAQIARICFDEHVPAFIHLSALNADERSPSGFLRSKAKGEKKVKEAFPKATIVRPGWLYGDEDRFINTMGSLTNKWPRPLFFGHHPVTDAQMRPIYVGDVARALEIMVTDRSFDSSLVELYG